MFEGLRRLPLPSGVPGGRRSWAGMTSVRTVRIWLKEVIKDTFSRHFVVLVVESSSSSSPAPVVDSHGRSYLGARHPNQLTTDPTARHTTQCILLYEESTAARSSLEEEAGSNPPRDNKSPKSSFLVLLPWPCLGHDQGSIRHRGRGVRCGVGCSLRFVSTSPCSCKHFRDPTA